MFETEENNNVIEMFARVEVPEAPTNGLENVVDWSGLEEDLLAGKFPSQTDFRAEVKRQFDEAGETFTRGWYRTALKGLFPEYRDLYRALPSNPIAERKSA